LPPPSSQRQKNSAIAGIALANAAAPSKAMQSPAGRHRSAGLCCSDAEVTYSSHPRDDPFLHANDLLSARCLTHRAIILDQLDKYVVRFPREPR
jgi:hypothetical protein